MTATLLAALAKGIAPVLFGLQRRIAVLEQKERGLDGKDGPPGPPGVSGPSGRDGRDGLPGLPGEKGANGLDGKDGSDGLGFDDLSVLHDGERAVTLRFVKGDRVKEFTVTIPSVIYRDVYTAGKAYARGDLVTWGGSLWHCNVPTNSKPGEGLKDWTLATKKGRDGKDGKDAPSSLPVVRT